VRDLNTNLEDFEQALLELEDALCFPMKQKDLVHSYNIGLPLNYSLVLTLCFVSSLSPTYSTRCTLQCSVYGQQESMPSVGSLEAELPNRRTRGVALVQTRNKETSELAPRRMKQRIQRTVLRYGEAIVSYVGLISGVVRTNRT